MSWSLNEVESLARKAACGAGFSWGLADEAGKAARWVSAAGWPGLEALADHLNRMDGQEHAAHAPRIDADPWIATQGELCPITTGAVLCDLARDWAQGRTLNLGPVAHPMMLVPFIALAADAQDSALRLSWDGMAIVHMAGLTDVSFTDAKALTRRSVDRVNLSTTQERPTGTLIRGFRVESAQTAIDVLLGLAARTYAPETEASRLSGAGAGLTDND